jgi:hypothetical protein
VIVAGGGSPSPAAVMLRQPRWAARRGTGRGRGGTHRYNRARRRRGTPHGHRGARSPGRRGRASRRSGRRGDRDRARQRRSCRHRGGRFRRGTGRHAGRRAVATRRAMARHQQRSRDRGRDEEDGHGTSSHTRPEAGLLQPGIDSLPEPGQASRACMTSPAIPASHEFGRYKATSRYRGPIAQTSAATANVCPVSSQGRCGCSPSRNRRTRAGSGIPDAVRTAPGRPIWTRCEPDDCLVRASSGGVGRRPMPGALTAAAGPASHQAPGAQIAGQVGRRAS